MGGQLSTWKLIAEASPMVQAVLVILIVMSIGSWFVVGLKWMQFTRARSQSKRFLDLFWGGDRQVGWNPQRLEAVYGQLMVAKRSPQARVFHAGYLELARVLESTDLRGNRIANVERALRKAGTSELNRLESSLSFLATTGSTAPFIGLFGTVWGIMFAITDLHKQSLPMVSQQIAEALIATAIGLAAAIPAVMAYNYFTRKIQVIEGEMDAFSNEYLNIIQRHVLSA